MNKPHLLSPQSPFHNILSLLENILFLSYVEPLFAATFTLSFTGLIYPILITFLSFCQPYYSLYLLTAGEYEVTLVPVQWELAKLHGLADHRYVAPARKEEEKNVKCYGAPARQRTFFENQWQNNRNLSVKLLIYRFHSLYTK